MWSFLWSSIQVRVLIVGICSFLVLVCREWRWISWTRNIVFHHGLAFSSLIFFLVLFWFWVNRCAFLLSGLLWDFLIILLYCLSIWLFHSVFLVTIFQSKIVRFLLRPVVGMFSCHLPLVDRIFFLYFVMSCFVCIVLPFVNVSLIFLLSPILSGLSPQLVIFSCVAFSFLFQDILASFVCHFGLFS